MGFPGRRPGLSVPAGRSRVWRYAAGGIDVRERTILLERRHVISKYIAEALHRAQYRNERMGYSAISTHTIFMEKRFLTGH